MNGTIASKNFKATFTIEYGGDVTSLNVTGTSSEARKYLKTRVLSTDGNATQLTFTLCNLENGLRGFVLAKIGG